MIVVGVCGASGSGKSTFAKRIRNELSCECVIIGQDCYYHDFSNLPFEERVALNYDDPNMFDYDELIQDIDALQAGKAISRKGYDFVNHVRNDSTEPILPPRVLILEGIHIFHDPRILDKMALKVYMHVDVDVCLLRRIRRDMKSRGRTIEAITEQYLNTVKPMYEKYISNYIKVADMAIMHGGKNAIAINCITTYLSSLLEADTPTLQE
jgi:Uridine kinase